MMHHTVDKDAVAYVVKRVRRAIKTLNALPDPERQFLYGQGAAWPEFIRDASEAYGYNEARPPRFEPTARDVDEMHEGMSWIVWLKSEKDGERDIKLVMARAYGVPWWRLSQKIGMSEKQLRRRFDTAHIKIWSNFKIKHTIT